MNSYQLKMFTTYAVLFVILVAIYLVIKKSRNKKAIILKELYEEALQGTDKRAALEAGRKYYAMTSPSGGLRPVDEQAIQNDISLMKSN